MMLKMLCISLVTCSLPAYAQTAGEALPKVMVIGTGGTIAGRQSEPGTLARYRAGAISVDEIVEGVPEIAKFADVESEQFSNVTSSSITPEHWVKLSKRINQLFRERPELAGVVVTHGTDRLEETAFFLYLTVKSDRPVVVVGAQRPATGISPDGPINLLSAVRTAASLKSRGMGVTVVMDDRIISARENRKLYPRSGGFEAGEMGLLGVMTGSGPEYFYAPVRKHGVDTDFDITEIDILPRVDLTYSYPGGDGYTPKEGTRGLVLATTGMAPGERPAFEEIRRKGIVLVTVFPSGEHVPGAGRNPSPKPEGEGTGRRPASAPPAVSAQHLLPQKARILLMLALTKTSDPREIQKIFNEY